MKTYRVTVDDNGIICWYNEKGKKHREDGPAVETPEGYKAYYINGKRHRLDGPAIVYSDGRKEYCLNGVRLSEEEFNNRNKKEMTVMETYKVEVDDAGTICWFNEDNKFHRLDGPAIEYKHGTKAYFINGKRHREDGPAVEYGNGTKEYWINDKKLTKEEFDDRNKKEMTVAEIEKELGYSIKIVKE